MFSPAVVLVLQQNADIKELEQENYRLQREVEDLEDDIFWMYEQYWEDINDLSVENAELEMQIEMMEYIFELQEGYFEERLNSAGQVVYVPVNTIEGIDYPQLIEDFEVLFELIIQYMDDIESLQDMVDFEDYARSYGYGEVIDRIDYYYDVYLEVR